MLPFLHLTRTCVTHNKTIAYSPTGHQLYARPWHDQAIAGRDGRAYATIDALQNSSSPSPGIYKNHGTPPKNTYFKHYKPSLHDHTSTQEMQNTTLTYTLTYPVSTRCPMGDQCVARGHGRLGHCTGKGYGAYTRCRSSGLELHALFRSPTAPG